MGCKSDFMLEQRYFGRRNNFADYGCRAEMYEDMIDALLKNRADLCFKSYPKGLRSNTECCKPRACGAMLNSLTRLIS